MARSRNSLTTLPPPYLKRVWLDPEIPADWASYPFTLPFLREFSLTFEHPITIVVGENGAGKSTLLEAIAGLVGFDEAGGAKGYRPLDHSRALEGSGTTLANSLRASWLPKVTTGWFFKAESFFSVARYLDEAAQDAGGPSPRFLSQSHGEGFLDFFEGRCDRQGVYIFDEPESALSPSKQLDFLKILRRMERSRRAQVLIATHSPLLMAYPGATLLQMTPYGLQPTTLEATEHFRLLREFFVAPGIFVDAILE